MIDAPDRTCDVDAARLRSDGEAMTRHCSHFSPSSIIVSRSEKHESHDEGLINEIFSN
jgi:hypothetical protein